MAWTAPFASFRGHRGAVNTLLSDDNKHANMLVSGSEDGSCRLWDVRTTRATKCINVKKALGLTPQDDPGDASVNALAFGKAPYLYLTAGSKVLTFDIRQEGLILDCAAKELFQDSEDEINSLSVHPSKGKFVSTADDNGDIRIYEVETHRLYKTLRGQHTNLCMSARFRPNAPWDLVSGGMDGLLLFWDFSRGRMKICIDFNTGVSSLASMNSTGAGGGTTDATGDSTASTSQLFNPPLVHSLEFAANGKSLAAGLGDGSVAVVDFNSKQIVRRLKNHAAAVSQVHFPAFKRDEWLLSCGNDFKISVFDYVGALSVDGEGRGGGSSSGTMEEEGAFVVKEFLVKDKPNAIASSLHHNVVHVADMSNVIASYPLL